jgi:TP901 family phage tail tape measure protein
LALPTVGLEAVIANLPKFEQGAKTITQAYDGINTKADAVGKVTERMGLKFDEASNRWRTASGKFASNAEIAAAGINKAKDAADKTGKSFVDLGSIAGKAGGQLVGLGSHLLSLGAIAGGAALAGVTALGAGLATFAVAGINKAIDLDAQMATIAATMNTTKEAVGPLKDLILDLALDPNLTVNTTQAADAIQLLAQNGVTAAEIMDGAAAATVALANATGAQFSTAADVASGVMKVFNIRAEDMGTAIDGITGVVNTSKFTIDDFSQAFAAAGGVAAEIGISFEDFSAVIAGTATSFNSGSDAGTSFKTLLQRLSNPTDENKDLMEQYGISLFDAEGKMKPFAEVVESLNAAFTGLTDAQKAQLAAQIGGADAAREVLALAGMTKDEFEKLSGNVNDSGQAFRSAATRVDSVKGAFEIFRGIVEAVQIQVGDKFLPILRGVTVGFTDLASKAGPVVVDFFGRIAAKIADLTKLFDERGLAGVLARFGFTGSLKFFRELSGLFSDITGKVPSLEGIGVIFKDLAKQVFPFLTKGVIFIRDFIATVTDLFTTFQSGGLFGSRSGSFGSVGLLAALGISPDIITTIQTIFDSITEAANAFMSGGLFGSVGLAGGDVSQTGGILEMLGLSDEAVIGIQNIFLGIVAAVTNFGTTWQAIWPTISASAQTAWILLQGIFNGIVATLTPTIEQLKVSFAGVGETFANLGITWATVGPALLQSTGIVFAAIGAIILGVISVVVSLVAAIGAGVASMITVWNELVPSVITAVSSLMVFLTGVTEIFSGIITGDWTQISQGFQIAWEGIAAGLPAIIASIVTIFTGLVTTISKTISGFVTAMIGFWTGLSETLIGHSIIPDLINGILDLFTKTKWLDIGKGIIDGIIKGIKENSAKVLELIKSLMGDLLSTAATAIGYGSPAAEFIPLGASIAEGLTAGINSGAGGVMAAMGNITQATLDSLLGVTRGLASTNNAIGAAADDVEKFLDSIGLKGSKGDATLKILKDTFRANADEILGATDRAEKFKEVLARTGVNWERIFVGGSVNPFAGKGGGILSFFINAFDERKTELEKAQQRMFIQAGKTALSIGNKLNDIVQGSIDILDTRVETLQELVDSGLESVNFEGMIISAVQAQDLLNAALQEQADIQDDILQLKQNEQKLSFLEKQLSLVETLNAAGLNVQDILGGISLGLDASIPDMIEATNRLVMALINQVNEDLQLGSPSKLMAKKGMQTGQGFVEGLMAQIPNITNAMKQAIVGPVSGPVLSGGSSSRVVNNNFNMAVNTGASPQNVMAQFEIARAMA